MLMPSRDKDFISLCSENSGKERKLMRYAGVFPKEEAQQSTRHELMAEWSSTHGAWESREVCGHKKQRSGPHNVNMNLTALQKYLKPLGPEGHPFTRTTSWQELLSSFMKTHFFPSTAWPLSQI